MTNEDEIGFGRFLATYAVVLTLGCVLGLVLEREFGVNYVCTASAYVGVVFVLAGSRRFEWLYATTRRVGWFGLIDNDMLMVVVLRCLGWILLALSVVCMRAI